MRIEYRAVAKDQLKKLPPTTQIRIARKIAFYAVQSDPLSFAKPLTGYDAYRFRIGNYRVIFELSRNTLFVLLIVKREGAYQHL